MTVFEEEDSLDNFEKFASLNGPNFYNLSPNKEKLKLSTNQLIMILLTLLLPSEFTPPFIEEPTQLEITVEKTNSPVNLDGICEMISFDEYICY